jgi:hypothetical protein
MKPDQKTLAREHASRVAHWMSSHDSWNVSSGLDSLLLPRSFRTSRSEGRSAKVVTTTGEQWFDTGFPVIIVNFDNTPPLRRTAFRARPRTFWEGVDRDGSSWHGVSSSAQPNMDAKKDKTLGPLTEWNDRRASMLRALQRDWISRGGQIATRNPDEDLRDLERRARHGDTSAKKRLSIERRRRGISDVPDYAWAEAELERVAMGYENADTFRVARADNEDEMLSFEALARRGCCGFHEWEATDPEGTRWVLGFNYGH